LRVVFAGTPPFAATALEAILAAGHAVALVVTQPDRRAGRGMRVSESAVAHAAARHALALLKPQTLRDAAARGAIADARAEVMVVAAFGLILPPEVLEIPPRGCLNIHASLLPRWRGAAPIQRAILAGDSATGITIMRMEAGLDTGPALLRKSLPIGPRDTAGSLGASLAVLGASCIVEALASLDRLVPEPQDGALATYAAKVEKREARIDWARTSAEIDRQVRAFNPAPGAETRVRGETLKIWEAQPEAAQGAPGRVLEAGPAGILVACGQGALRVTSLQRGGGKRMGAGPFLLGCPLETGLVLGDEASAAAANPTG
jgi:methionyl-tRNA formyltransferase